MDNFKGSQAFYKKFSKNLLFSSKNINKNQVILAAGEFNRYLPVQSHQELIDISEKYGKENCLCESRINSKMVNLFFDYDCKDDPQTTSQCIQTLKSLKSNIQSIFPQLDIQFYVKDSKEPSGRINSMHIVTHLSTPDGYSIYFDYSKGCSQVKHFVSKLRLEHPFDHKQAYSGHLLRLIYSNKFNKDGSLANRILDFSALSDFDDEYPLKSLTSYCPNPNFMLLDDYVNKHFILQFVKSHEYSKNYLFSQIVQRDNESHLSLTLTEQRTPLCEHKSNNAVCMFYNNTDNPNVIIKCMDEECGKFVQTFFRYDDNQHRCQIITTGNNSSDSQITLQSDSGDLPNNEKLNDLEAIQFFALKCCQFLPQETACRLLKILSISPNSATLLGQPPQNNQALSFVLGTNNQQFQCQDNQLSFSINGRQTVIELWSEMVDILKNIEKKYSEKQLEKQNIIYNYGQYVENLQQQINNNYGSSRSSKKDDDEKITGSVDHIPFDDEKEKFLLNKLFNRRMHYITDLYELLQPRQFIYKPAKDGNQSIFYFTNLDDEGKETNGGHWSNEDGPKELIKRIRNTLETYFDEKKSQAEEKYQKGLNTVFNIILNTVEKQFQILQYAMETFKRKNIEFNQKIHLLHFQNGTYDMEEKEFVNTTPNMYNTQQIKYNYNKNAKYDFIEPVVRQIIGDQEYEWFVQQLAYCLMPDRILEKKQIVILTGQGDNGKTLIFNLMNNTVDTKAYGVNGRSLMIQATNEQLSNATPDLMTLKDMRFCYFAELDVRKSFNQQQVKMLTGAERVKGRNLYGNLDEFEAHAGLFVACNQLPRIDCQDGGFLNRLKIIQLQKQFVENPDNNNQFHLKKEKTLLNQVKSMKWRQGFMKMLLDYHYKDEIPVPKSVEQYIEQKINLNKDPVTMWAEEYIDYEKNGFATLEELLESYNQNKETKSRIGQETFKMRFEQFLRQNPTKFSTFQYIRKLIPKSLYPKYDIDHNVKQARKYVYTNLMIKNS